MRAYYAISLEPHNPPGGPFTRRRTPNRPKQKDTKAFGADDPGASGDIGPRLVPTEQRERARGSVRRACRGGARAWGTMREQWRIHYATPGLGIKRPKGPSTRRGSSRPASSSLLLSTVSVQSNQSLQSLPRVKSGRSGADLPGQSEMS